MSQRAAGIKHGWRSGLEERVASELDALGVDYEYESETFEYTPPVKVRRYTPDFVVTTRSGHKIYVETKGRWVREDRLKLQAVLAWNPGLDLRLVFQTPNARISKTSRTTYAAWCEKHLRVPWAKGSVPQEWLDE
jgi:hypothetical protein